MKINGTQLDVVIYLLPYVQWPTPYFGIGRGGGGLRSLPPPPAPPLHFILRSSCDGVTRNGDRSVNHN